MKLLNKIGLIVVLTALILVACDKKDDLLVQQKGTPAVLSSSAATLTPVAADSNNTVLTLDWTSPGYATDSANYKFIIEIDSAGKNFAKPDSKTIMGELTTSYLAKELNTMLLARGYAFNVPVDMDVRVVSSYGNNNEQYKSNTVQIKMTPYLTPPKVPVPASDKLYIVGDASQFGWSNPVPMPADRELSKLFTTKWGGIFNLTGSGAYKLLQTPGEWGTQYHMLTGGDASSGSFELRDADPGFPSPAAAGWYKMIFDFQFGTYEVTATETPFTGTAPDNLYIVGDATQGGWDNPVPVATQQFTKLSPTLFELTINLTADKSYLLLPLNGNWDHKFGGTDKSFGSLLDDGNVPSSNTPAPAVSGMYKITVNFGNHTYTVTPV